MERDLTELSYEIVWSDEAEQDLAEVRAFDQPRIRKAVDELGHQAETPTRNRSWRE